MASFDARKLGSFSKTCSNTANIDCDHQRKMARSILRDEGDQGIPPDDKNIPRRQSEAEEAEWWDTHRQDEARPKHSIRTCEQKAVSAAAPLPARPAFQPQPSAWILSIAPWLAPASQKKMRGLKYQTYLKMIVQEALTRDWLMLALASQELPESQGLLTHGNRHHPRCVYLNERQPRTDDG